ncbi:hypothetical protein SCHPADRAFT_740701 [Schizopora paradoxa]|uniref:F-box domain-containing protein n=1 Tax=Schizopora paradoxa TaxID=27342 RepID=A0A0H2RJN7_9AGAM|nr:hypothetical protein SCHPADRAFT_740701 [Schizopora paradoxa]
MENDRFIKSNAMERNKHRRQHLMSHSSSAPLRIHLNVDQDDLAYVPNHIHPFLVQELHWWRFVDIDVTSGQYSFARKPTTLSLQCPTSLRSLSLKLFGSSSPSICIDLSQHNSTSCLEHLSLGVGERIRLPDHRDTLRFPRLRSFHYKSTKKRKDLEDLRCILSTCPSLEDLELGISRKSISSTASIPGSIYLPNLTSLVLKISNQFALQYTLDILTYPSLRELSLFIQGTRKYESEEDHAFLEPLRICDLLVRSCPSPPLEILRFLCDDAEVILSDYAAALKDLLSSLRNLKSLELSGFALNRVVLQVLTIPPGAPDIRLCPSLSEILLAQKSPREESDVSDELTEEMVVSRWKARSLRAVTFKLFPWLAAMKKRERMVECSREGLEVRG